MAKRRNCWVVWSLVLSLLAAPVIVVGLAPRAARRYDDYRLVSKVREAAALGIKPQQVESFVGWEAMGNTACDGPHDIDGIWPDPDEPLPPWAAGSPGAGLALDSATDVVYWMRPGELDCRFKIVGIAWRSDGTVEVFYGFYQPTRL